MKAAEAEPDAFKDEERFVLGRIAGVGGALRADSLLHNTEMLGRLDRLADSSQPIGRMDLRAWVSIRKRSAPSRGVPSWTRSGAPRVRLA